jgi:predicted O-methyltransferase YrrM
MQGQAERREELHAMNAAAISEALERRRQLVGLPPHVALFFARARRLAARRGDHWSLTSATGPRALAHVLREARGQSRFVEIGTGTAWTAIAGALAEPGRNVVSFDPVVRAERDWYLALAGSAARNRIELVHGVGESGPGAESERAGFVFIDGSHDRDRTIHTFEAWRDTLVPGGAIAFHDWQNERYPGVTDAIEALGLNGDVCGDVFVWRPRPRLAH